MPYEEIKNVILEVNEAVLTESMVQVSDPCGRYCWIIISCICWIEVFMEKLADIIDIFPKNIGSFLASSLG